MGITQKTNFLLIQEIIKKKIHSILKIKLNSF